MVPSTQRLQRWGTVLLAPECRFPQGRHPENAEELWAWKEKVKGREKVETSSLKKARSSLMGEVQGGSWEIGSESRGADFSHVSFPHSSVLA